MPWKRGGDLPHGGEITYPFALTMRVDVHVN